jgi:glycosyltransferase involved in cell wall biosynthesis
MQVTVAICTWNRCELLRKTLEQMTALVVPAGVGYELLIINNSCTDATDAVVAEFMDRLPIRMVVEAEPGLSAARNRSIAEARFDWILFTDDDVLVDPQWLASFAAAVERHPDVSVAGGPIEPWFPIAPDRTLAEVFPELERGFCGLDHDLPEGEVGPDRPVWGANFAIRRSALGDLRFNTHVGKRLPLGDDTDFVRRTYEREGRVLWIPVMRVTHYVDPERMTVAYLRRYRAVHGANHQRFAALPMSPVLFGAPRWLWRASAATYTSYMLFRLLGQRRRALEQLRDHSFYRGMLAEARQMRRASDGAHTV